MKMYAHFKKLFLIRVFWFKYILQIKFEIRILDLKLLLKNSVPFEGLYYSSLCWRYYLAVAVSLSCHIDL